jgi:opacity protein-like surface antigen
MIRARRSAGISAALRAAEVFMKKVSLMFSMVALIASPLYAQTERGYVAGEGGFAMTHETTSGDALVEGGIRVAPHLLLFGDVGQFHDVQPSDVQPSVDTTTALLSSAQGLTTIGTGGVPAWYAQSRLRYEMPLAGRITPYALGGLGFARLCRSTRKARPLVWAIGSEVEIDNGGDGDNGNTTETRRHGDAETRRRSFQLRLSRNYEPGFLSGSAKT